MFARMANKVQLKSETIVDSQPQTTHLPASYAFEISCTLLFALVLFVVYRKASRIGRAQATKVYNQKVSQLKDELYAGLSRYNDKFDQFSNVNTKKIEDLTRAQAKFEKSLWNSKLIPTDHVLVSYAEEGVSHHTRADGYVMRVECKFEHRATAEETLGRALAANEVVHHIYPPARDDNSLENLCVLDRDQHDLFHTFIEREVKLKGKFPRITEQKNFLKQHFHGILLEDAHNKKRVAFPPIKPVILHEQSLDQSN